MATHSSLQLSLMEFMNTLRLPKGHRVRQEFHELLCSHKQMLEALQLAERQNEQMRSTLSVISSHIAAHRLTGSKLDLDHLEHQLQGGLGYQPHVELVP